MESLFKDLIWDNLVRAAIKKLFAALPILSWGPIGWFVTRVIYKYADVLYIELRDAAKIKSIALRNKQLEKQFHLASIDLKVIAMNKGEESDEYIKAKEIAKDKLSDLVRITL